MDSLTTKRGGGERPGPAEQDHSPLSAVRASGTPARRKPQTAMGTEKDEPPAVGSQATGAEGDLLTSPAGGVRHDILQRPFQDRGPGAPSTPPGTVRYSSQQHAPGRTARFPLGRSGQSSRPGC